jgi:hypothetical protein
MRFILATATAALLLLDNVAAHAEMKLTSNDLSPGKTMSSAQIFNQFGCTGANASPQLAWSGAPQGTKSYAILAFDPDAPTGSGWWHWIAYNIPAQTNSLPTAASRTGALPKGMVESRNDFGLTGYSGACPPAKGGVHRYQFTVYALSVADLTKVGFPIDANAPAAMVSFIVHATALGHATIEVPLER